MSVALAMTWNPRGETERFRRFYPEFSQWYAGVAVVTPPDPDPEAAEMLKSLPEVRMMAHGDWGRGTATFAGTGAGIRLRVRPLR